MPTENDKPKADAKDTEIASLKTQLESLAQANANLAKENDALAQDLEYARKELKDASTRVTNIEKKLKDAKSAPTGDYVHMGGKTYAIEGTVSARFAGDEGRKGHLPEGLDTELVILKRS